jgi:curved DNA-binding protein CbpA
VEGKTIRVRCLTWDQVEAFYTEKLKGNILVVKMPFRPGIGETMTVALSLPDGLVFAIDGTVMKIGADEGGRLPVAVRLLGMTPEVRAQLKRLVAHGRGNVTPVGGTRAMGTVRPHPPAPPMPRGPAETVPPPSEPRVDEVPEEEREAWSALSATRERILAQPVHDVLGVPDDADPARAQTAFLALALRVHPDRFRRYRSRSMLALASETFIHLARAYDRMLDRAPPQAGWLLELGDGAEAATSDGVPSETIAGAGSSPYSELSITSGPAASGSYEDDVTFTTSVRMRALTAEELFDEEPTHQSPVPGDVAAGPPVLDAVVPDPAPAEDKRKTFEAEGRAALAESRWRDACEAFAAYLRLEPKDRATRALYHYANGMDLRARGEGVKAQLQFETALAHDRALEPARRALVPEGEAARKGLLKRLFDK